MRQLSHLPHHRPNRPASSPPPPYLLFPHVSERTSSDPPRQTSTHSHRHQSKTSDESDPTKIRCVGLCLNPRICRGQACLALFRCSRIYSTTQEGDTSVAPTKNMNFEGLRQSRCVGVPTHGRAAHGTAEKKDPTPAAPCRSATPASSPPSPAWPSPPSPPTPRSRDPCRTEFQQWRIARGGRGV